MVEHIVLFELKPETTPEQVGAMEAGLQMLATEIPGIIGLTFGENFSDRNKGSTHGLVVRFTDRAALEVYIPHPAHQSVVEELVRPILDEIIVVDYEI